MWLSTNGFVGWLIYEYNTRYIGYKICKNSGKMCVKIQGGCPPRYIPTVLIAALVFSAIGFNSEKVGLFLSAIFLLLTAGSWWQVILLPLLFAVPSWVFPILSIMIVRSFQVEAKSRNGRDLDPTIPICSAMKWIRSTYPNCETIKLVGYSSGGTLAAMYSLLDSTTEDANNKEKVGKLASTVYCLSGIYDLEATIKSFGSVGRELKRIVGAILGDDLKQCPTGVLRAQLSMKEELRSGRAVKRIELIHCSMELFGLFIEDYIFKPRMFKELLNVVGVECDIHVIKGSHWGAFFSKMDEICGALRL